MVRWWVEICSRPPQTGQVSEQVSAQVSELVVQQKKLLQSVLHSVVLPYAETVVSTEMGKNVSVRIIACKY